MIGALRESNDSHPARGNRATRSLKMAKANVTVVNVNRAFDKRASKDGTVSAYRIGTIESTWEIGAVTINGAEISSRGVEHLLNFAFQSLQDAYAGSENETDAVAAWGDKLNRIINGTIGARVAGSGQSALMREVFSLIGANLRENNKTEWKAMSDDDKAATIEAKYEALSDDVKAKVTELAQTELDRKRAEAEARANALGAAKLVL